MKFGLTAAACFAISVMGVAQAPVRDQARVTSNGTASVTGLVLADDAVHAPLRRAIVSLSRANVEDIRTTGTDDEGRYVFPNLPAGSYTLSASRGGYIATGYGAPKAGMPGTSITLAEGQTFHAQPIALLKGAVIAGRITDRSGRAASNVTVEALPLITFNGERRRRSGNRQSVQTNAHGDYRIFGLLPGEYLVSSSANGLPAQGEPTAADLDWASRQGGPPPPSARTFTYTPTLFPGTADASRAAAVTLERGEERLGVDFALQYVPVARVSGVVTAPDGRPPLEASAVCALKAPSPLLAAPQAISRGRGDGSFSCEGLAPGHYVVWASGVPNNLAPGDLERMRAGIAALPLSGSLEIDVSGRDITGVSIPLSIGVSVSGQLVFEGSTPADSKRFQVRLVRGPGGPPINTSSLAVPASDGTFQIDGLAPGPYRVVTTIPPASAGAASAWSLKSATLAGNDISDVSFDLVPNLNVSGLVVTFSDVQTELAGTLTGPGGSAAPQLYVFVFPANKNLWTNGARRVRYVRTAENGSYVIPGLPSGEYYLSTLIEFEPVLQYEPGYLELLVPSASKITLGEGEKKRLDLKIGG